MASLRSCNVERTTVITRCIRSISCLRKIFIGAKAFIAFNLARTYQLFKLQVLKYGININEHTSWGM